MLRTRALALTWALAAALLPVVAMAQTTTAPGIDVEVYNTLDGTNRFCVAPAGSFWANVLVRPGTGTTSCAMACTPSPVAGGSANLATGAVDLAFDPARLSFVSAESNPATAAVDGLIQAQNVAQGRVGWALAGDWTPNADPNGVLDSPCATGLLTTSGWVYRAQLTGTVPGMTTLRLRQPGDAVPFQLSFADLCGSPAFTQANGAVNEVLPAVVLVNAACATNGVIFFDNFERGSAGAWSTVIP